MKILYHGTFGTDDPTRASLPLLYAKGAHEAGYLAQVFLAGEATYLFKKGIADSVQGVGIPSLKELFQSAVEHELPLFA